MGVGLFEVAILLFIVFLFLGSKRITNLMRALGRGVRDFKTEFDDRAVSGQRSAISEDKEANDEDQRAVSESPGEDQEKPPRGR
jgi:TatA/E family protein of Tat protein translocase